MTRRQVSTSKPGAGGWPLLVLFLVSLLTAGCGNTLYLVQVTQAEEAFEEARELGAEQHSPYEYYAAEARLREAKVQAARAEYGNAAELSNQASEFAEKAIVKTKTTQQTQSAPLQSVGVAR